MKPITCLLLGALLLGACGDDAAPPGGDATADTDASAPGDSGDHEDTAPIDVSDATPPDAADGASEDAADAADGGADATFDVDEPTDALPALTGAIELALGADDGSVRVQPSVALGADGRLALVYTGKVGESLGLPGSLGQLTPAVGAAAGGALVVAWEEYEQAGFFTKTLARVVPAPPAPLGDVVTLAQVSLTDVGGAFLAVDPADAGRYVGAGVAGARLRLAHVNDGVKTPLPLPETTSTLVPAAALAAAGEDRYALVYLDGVSGEVHAKLAYIRAGAVEAPVILGTGRFQAAYQPAIDVRNGRVVAAWTESRGGGAYAIRLSLFRR